MQITFLTLNIWRGGLLFDNFIEFIKSENPDIFNLQEVYNGQDSNLENYYRTYDILKKEFSQYQNIFAPMFTNKFGQISIDMGNATFSKYPIVEHKAYFYDKPFDILYEDTATEKDFANIPRNLLHTSINIDNTFINVFNTHGSWGKDGNDNDRRLRMSEVIVDKVSSLSKVILSGDFNTEPHTKTIKNIEKHLTSVFPDVTSTFNVKHKKGGTFYKSVVDYVFVSRDVKVVKKMSPQVNVSDHMPLVCILEI